MKDLWFIGCFLNSNFRVESCFFLLFVPDYLTSWDAYWRLDSKWVIKPQIYLIYK